MTAHSTTRTDTERTARLQELLTGAEQPDAYVRNLPPTPRAELHRMLQEPVTSPDVLNRVVALVANDGPGPKLIPYWKIHELIKDQPGLTAEHLRQLVRAVVRRNLSRDEADAIADALLGHRTTQLWGPALAASLLSFPIPDPCALERPTSGDRNRYDVLQALLRRGHPVGAAAAIALRDWHSGPLEWSAVEAVLAQLGPAAAQARVTLADLTWAVCRLYPSWTGTGPELLDTAVAVQSR